MLFATTDVIPQSYEILCMVGNAVPTSKFTPLKGVGGLTEVLNNAQESLGAQPGELGGNGVIGIRYTALPINVVYVSGTAIRLTS